jgi:hypothetical protein
LKAYICSAVRVCSWSLATAVVLLFARSALCDQPATTPEALPATTPEALPATATATAPASQPARIFSADELPSVESFKVMDKPGDDGSSVIVQWAKPAKELPRTLYVVEVAKSPKDFGTDKAQTVEVEPLEKNLAKSNREVFGYGKETERTYFLEVSAADAFPMDSPKPHYTPDDLKKLVDDKIISSKQAGCIERVLANQKALAAARRALGPVQTALAFYQNMLTGELAKGGVSAQAKVDVQDAKDKLGKAQDVVADARISLSDAWDGWADPKQALGSAGSSVGKLREVLKATEKLLADISLPATHKSALGNCESVLAKASETVTKATDKLPDCTEKELRWFHYLRSYIGKEDNKALAQSVRESNKQTLYFRLTARLVSHSVVIAGAQLLRDGKPVVASAAASPNLFKNFKLNNLIFSLVFCAIVFAFIQVAKRNPNLFIRKIGGLEAVDEAIGRSTEMNKPVFFVHGLGDMSDIGTISSVNILGRVATRAAEHDSRVMVMNCDPIVTAVSQEVVQQGYLQAGRPDAFNADDVSLVATDQFSYVAAVSGRMVREQPGAIFLLGYFAAESLLLAETGAATGAIQIAGTDQYTQLPFFITTCDYTLIGEELYAASAYLSREPRLLGSLRGQDVGKAFLMVVLVLVPIILTIAVWQGWDFGWLKGFLSGGKG